LSGSGSPASIVGVAASTPASGGADFVDSVDRLASSVLLFAAFKYGS
jgi:hypothetical protein